MIHYSTLRQVRDYLKLLDAETDDDELLKRFIRDSVTTINKTCRRRFDIRRQTRLFDYPLKRQDRLGVYSAENFVAQMTAVANWIDQRLKMDEDLLEVIVLTNGDDNEIEADDFILEPPNLYPKHCVRLVEGSGAVWETGTGGERRQVISIDGYWGYHNQYGDEDWVDTLDTVQDNPLSPSATSLTVGDADGVAADTLAYRFQPGNMIKITTGGVTEFLFIVAANYTTNVLTVTRGFNGTTGTEHAQGTAIYVYRPMDNIVRACTRLVAWAYRQKDTDTFDKAAILGTGVAIIPSALPADVQALLPAPKSPRL